MGLVGYQLWRLRKNLKAGVFGSRLAIRLVLLFALVAVLPGALLYGVSVQFLGKSIESWFDVRVDRGARRRIESRPRRARLSAQGNDKQGHAAGADSAGRRRGEHAAAAQSRQRAGGHIRGGAVYFGAAACSAVARHLGLDADAGAAARAGAAPRAGCSKPYSRHRPDRRSGPAVARRRSGQHLRSRRAAAPAAGGRAGAASNCSRMPRRYRPAIATTRRSRFRASR